MTEETILFKKLSLLHTIRKLRLGIKHTFEKQDRINVSKFLWKQSKLKDLHWLSLATNTKEIEMHSLLKMQ